MESKQVGKGCLPYFIFVLILVFIRAQFAPGKSWENDFLTILEFFYWLGIAYMILVVVINKSIEVDSRKKPKTNIPEQNTTQSHRDNDNKTEDKKKRENLEINLLYKSWIDYNEEQLLKNTTLLDLLEVNSINSITYSMLLNCFEWKYKRFKILIRDKFECQDCNEKSTKLHVHHKYYIYNKLPWEIDETALVALCKICHSKRHEKENINVFKYVNGRLILSSYHFFSCPRCYGSGYLPQFRHVENGICFLCFGNVLSETIFSKRLKLIEADRDLYNTDSIKRSMKDFMNSIPVEFYSTQINDKLFSENDSLFLYNPPSSSSSLNSKRNSINKNESDDDRPF